jgi:hypothetical protein
LITGRYKALFSSLISGRRLGYSQQHIQCVEGIISLKIKRPGREAEDTYLTPKIRLNGTIPVVLSRIHRVNCDGFTLNSIRSKTRNIASAQCRTDCEIQPQLQ